jgi:hypothetical protein
MSSSAAGGNGRPFRGGPLIPILFFITPLFTAASPRTAPFFLPIVAAVLMIAALRRGLPWRDLLKPNAALFALLAVSAYTGLTAIWAADLEAALSKCGLLLATTHGRRHCGFCLGHVAGMARARPRLDDAGLGNRA